MRRTILLSLLLLFVLSACSSNRVQVYEEFTIDPVLDTESQEIYFMVFDGKPYHVGVLLSTLVDGGFMLMSGGQLQPDSVLLPGQSVAGTLAYVKDGETLVDVTVQNINQVETELADCRIVRFEMRLAFTSVSVVLANDIEFGTHVEDVVLTFGTDFMEETHALGTALIYRVKADDVEVGYQFVFDSAGNLNSFSMNDFR